MWCVGSKQCGDPESKGAGSVSSACVPIDVPEAIDRVVALPSVYATTWARLTRRFECACVWVGAWLLVGGKMFNENVAARA